jgi:hypothetical protein
LDKVTPFTVLRGFELEDMTTEEVAGKRSILFLFRKKGSWRVVAERMRISLGAKIGWLDNAAIIPLLNGDQGILVTVTAAGHQRTTIAEDPKNQASGAYTRVLLLVTERPNRK